jgi:hypothetical protein
MKSEIASLKRTITRLKKQHNTEMVKAAKVHLEEIDKVRASLADANSQLNEANAKISQQKRRLEESNEDFKVARNWIASMEKVFDELQRDMKTVCEAVYGPDFDPEWRGDRPMNIWQDGQEYTPVNNGVAVDAVSVGYMEPMQRLTRMLWRRIHWVKNPIARPHYHADGESDTIRRRSGWMHHA